MRITNKYYEDFIKYVRIKPNDIPEIVFDSLKLNKEIEVHGNGYIIDDPTNTDEYTELSDEQFSTLTIIATSPNFLIKFSSLPNRGTRLFVVDDSEHSKWFYDRIHSKLHSLRSKFWVFITESLMNFSLLVSIAFAIVTIFYDIFSTVFLILGLYLFLYYSIYILYRQTNEPGAMLKKEREEKNFFQRNKDKILVGIIFTVFGGLMTALAMIIVN